MDFGGVDDSASLLLELQRCRIDAVVSVEAVRLAQGSRRVKAIERALLCYERLRAMNAIAERSLQRSRSRALARQR